MKSDKTYIGDEIDLYFDEESATIILAHTSGSRVTLTPASYENLFNYATQIGFKEMEEKCPSK